MAPRGRKDGKGASSYPARGNLARGAGMNTTAIYLPTGVGGHWAELLHRAREAANLVNSGDDEELEHEINASTQALASQFEQYITARPDEEAEVEGAVNSTQDFALELAARLMDRVGADLFGGRAALLLLTRAEWDLELAVQRAVSSLSTQPVLTLRPETEVPTEAEISQARMRELNPNVDREPVHLGVVTPASFTITLNQPEGPPQTHQFLHTANFDWNSSEAIQKLNKWRSQRFLRDLGPKEPRRVEYTESEQAWLEVYVETVHGIALGASTVMTLTFVEIQTMVNAFNDHFAGETIVGSDQMRPRRHESSIRAELARLNAVVRMTGMAGRSSEVSKGTKGDKQGKGGKGDPKGGPPGGPARRSYGRPT